MDIMQKIEELLAGGESPKEIMAKGFARSTVYAVAKKFNKSVKKNFEVELEIFDLIQQMAQWISLLITDSQFTGGAKSVPCLSCTVRGETDATMKLNEGEDIFECPKCGTYLWNARKLSFEANIRLVQERIKREFKPPATN